MMRSGLLLLGLALAGCAGPPPPPPPPPVLKLTVAAGAGQNPETDGKPAPVAIRLYQLASAGAFQQADVYALMNNAAVVLGPDLISSETMVVNPGQTLKAERPVKPGALFLGAAVLFRDIDHATWRATAPLAASGPTTLTLATDKLGMSLKP